MTETITETTIEPRPTLLVVDDVVTNTRTTPSALMTSKGLR